METRQGKQSKQTKKRRQYSGEFREGAVKLVLEQERSVADVGRDLGIHRSVIDNWVRQAKVDQGKGRTGALTTVEREELARLKKENRELRMERELLKKWAAFFARENA